MGEEYLLSMDSRAWFRFWTSGETFSTIFFTFFFFVFSLAAFLSAGLFFTDLNSMVSSLVLEAHFPGLKIGFIVFLVRVLLQSFKSACPRIFINTCGNRCFNGVKLLDF